jgi:hypothetical protein
MRGWPESGQSPAPHPNPLPASGERGNVGDGRRGSRLSGPTEFFLKQGKQGTAARFRQTQAMKVIDVNWILEQLHAPQERIEQETNRRVTGG